MAMRDPCLPLLTVSETGPGVPSGVPACCWCSWLVLLDHLSTKCHPQLCTAKVREQKSTSGTVLASQILHSYFTEKQNLAAVVQGCSDWGSGWLSCVHGIRK